jgi:hypothetical protein
MRILTLLACFISILPVEGQKIIKNTEVTGVCYAGNNIKRVYIPPRRIAAKGERGGNITVYYTGFSTQAKDAFEYAASIMELYLPAGTDLTIKASYERLGSGVLGNSVITGYAAGWDIDALDPLAYYPVSVAEKIAGSKLNTDQEGDMEMKVSNAVNWYYGTDGKTPTTQYDFVTVVLHEMCHGLGFFDSMTKDQSTAYHLEPVPLIYDKFLENLSGQRLADTLVFPNYSAGLLQQLTGGQVYFEGPVLAALNNGTRARLYAPGVWDSGSSISHLDETYNGENSLMTPYVDKGEAVHDPGNMVMAILGDLGWMNIRIIHSPLKDTEEHLSVIPISIEIKSDTTFNRSNVAMVYSFDNFNTSRTVYLNSPNADNIFNASVTIPSYNTGFQYYFSVEDCFLRKFNSPSYTDEIRYSTYVGTDTVHPLIAHNKIKYCLQTDDTIKFNVNAYDNIGIDTVYVEYRVNGGPSQYLGLYAGENDEFKYHLPLGYAHLNGGDEISYRIIASDLANVTNVTILPQTGFYSFNIEKIKETIENYTTDFSVDNDDFFNLGFSITRPSGFTEYGLHTPHPYESPEDNNDSIEYISLFRHPLRFDETGLLISYKEIVLVEPGETGSVFGSSDFYDYVIIEASKNFGKTWFRLADGYDSRYYKPWETAYNNEIVGNNSLATGTESMLREHVIFCKPSATMVPGDVLLIRFRLFSDPFANGWGWAIQDLKLNALINSIDDSSPEPFSVFPNPGNGHINMKGISDYRFSYSVYNSSGTCVIKDKVSDGTGNIDISDAPPGIYLIVVNQGKRLIPIRYSLIK